MADVPHLDLEEESIEEQLQDHAGFLKVRGGCRETKHPGETVRVIRPLEFLMQTDRRFLWGGGGVAGEFTHGGRAQGADEHGHTQRKAGQKTVGPVGTTERYC